ncbi:TonB-dependent receptor [Asticcacaulis sp. AC466]|uniref:TonB-dependent receptor n=1 Tax=Asticcacaulis sp. AC466 TaxID=1282362 RepID=UPI0003F6B3E1|nr:TonB-dependent receptor [Asticcacaulis sp. AC466]
MRRAISRQKRSLLMLTTALGLGGVFAGSAPAIAWAQATPPAAVAPSDGSGDAIPEVIITASKRSTKLLKTPLAVSALTQDALTKQGVVDIKGLATSVPNLQMGSNGDSSTAITMRGVSSTDTTEVAEAAVSMHQDGFYSPRPQGALALMYDVERVEVLRGPQGTLFGMNSPGGVINVIPAKPVFGRYFGKADASLSSYNGRDLHLTYNFGLADNFAIRVNYMAAKRDGYGQQVEDFTDLASPANGIVKDGIPDVYQGYNHAVSPKNYYNNQNEWAARIMTRWQVNDRLELSLTLSRFADNGAGDHDYVDCKSAVGTAAACDHQLRYLLINVPGYVRMTLDDYQFKATYNVNDNMVLEYRGGFEDERRHQLTDNDGGAYAPAAWSSIGEAITPEQQATQYYPVEDTDSLTASSNYRSMTHEIQLKSNGDHRLNYVLGAFYLYEHKQINYQQNSYENKTYDAASGTPDGLPWGVYYDQRNRTTESKALFGQFDYKITDTLTATVGGRYSWDHKGDHGGLEYGFFSGDPSWYNGQYTPGFPRAHQSNNLTPTMGTGAVPGTALPLFDVTDSDMKWNVGTYRLGLQYNPSANHMFYGAIASGYKMGGMYETADFCNNGCIQLLTYRPEHVTNYEVGYKGKLFDNRLQLSTALFFEDYHDMQNTGDKVIGTNTDPSSPLFGRPVTAWTTDNLPKARIDGVEVEFESKPWKNGHLNGYVSWLDATVVKGTLIDEYACGERQIFNQAQCGPSDQPISIKGNRLPFAPEFSFSVNYSHDIRLNNGYLIQPYVLVHWQSKMWLDVRNYDGAHLAQSQAAYSKVDVNLRVTPPTQKFFVELYGQNLGNVATKNFQFLDQGHLRASYDAPRMLGIRMGSEF